MKNPAGAPGGPITRTVANASRSLGAKLSSARNRVSSTGTICAWASCQPSCQSLASGSISVSSAALTLNCIATRL